MLMSCIKQFLSIALWNSGLAKCSHDPRQYAGQAIGMYHCPECGCMVIAGVEHTPCMPESCWLKS